MNVNTETLFQLPKQTKTFQKLLGLLTKKVQPSFLKTMHLATF